MKGILLAGGTGTRIWPASAAVNKQLLPVYDKPMIYYPLTTLMLAGVDEILLITNPRSRAAFQELLGNGSQWGIEISYAVQEKPNGIPEAFLLVPPSYHENPVVLMLGDNLLYGSGLGSSLGSQFDNSGAQIFAYQVSNPKDYGIVEIDIDGKPLRITEKPAHPRSNYAIPGLYFFDQSIYEKVKKISPSERGELEIADILNAYLNDKKLNVQILQRGTAWLDTGSAQSLLAAGEFVRVVEERQGLKIGCPEEVSLRMGLISELDYSDNLNRMPEGSYRSYLESISDVSGSV